MNDVHTLRDAFVSRLVKAVFLVTLVLLLGVTQSAFATINFVQAKATAPDVAGTSITATFTSAQTAGNLNVVAVGFISPTLRVSSVTDSKGNTYTLAVGPTSDSNSTHYIYYAKNIVAATAGSNTVTVTFNGSVQFPDLRVAEYSGLDTTAPLDVTAAATGSSTSLNSGSVTTSNANDLIVGADLIQYTHSAVGSGFTSRILSPDSSVLEDKIVTSTGSYSATVMQNTSGWWIMQMAAFKAAAGSGDTTPPTAPTGLTATVASSSQINLSWTAATDDVAVTGYRVERCSGASCTTFAQISTPTTTSYSDTGLTASTIYSYRVRATDAAGNLGSYSSTASATTSAASDTTAPTAPTGLTATAASSTAINLSWTASTDNVAVTGYRVERCAGSTCTTFAQIATPTTTSYSDTGLTASTTYRYRVRATDAAGNLGSYSSIASATTSAAADTTAPTAPTGLTATAASTTQINVSWTAATDNVAVTGYRVERCSGSACTTFAQIATPTTTSYSDTGLTASTAYRYQVRATDAAGNLGSYSSIASATTQTPDTTAPSAPTGLTATAASSSAINLSWTASTDNVAVTGYLLERCTGASCTTFAQIGTSTTTTYSDTGLTASTTYRYQVRARDAANNNSAYSSIASATTTAAATVAFVQAKATAPDVAGTSITANFTSAQTAGNLIVVAVGFISPTLRVSTVTDSKGNTYTLAVGPTSNTLATHYIYYAKNIVAATAGSNTVTVTFNGSVNYPDLRVAEYSGLDTTAPLDVTAAATGSSTSLNSGSATTTNANDLIVGADLIQYTHSAVGSGFTSRILSPDSSVLEDKIVTSTGSNSATVTQNTSGWWIMQMAAFKAGGGGGDTTAPSAPSGLTATAASGTQINLSWTAATDNVAVTGYHIERCSGASCSTFAEIGTTTTAVTFSDTGLTNATSYSYRVRANDAAANLGAYTSTASATTTDTQAPTAPTGLGATVVSGTQINLSWTASTDNVGVTGYRVERCTGTSCSSFSQVGTPTTLSYNDTGLTAGNTYGYRVRAVDAAGNLGSYSSTVYATTTAADTTAPSAPTGLTATAASASQINLSWTAATDDVAVTGYRVERCSGVSCSTFAQISSPTTTSVSDSGLTAGTSYTYRVRATDAAGNLGSYSGNATAVTSVLVTTYTYYSNGRLQTATTGTTVTTYTYDAAGNTTSIVTTP